MQDLVQDAYIKTLCGKKFTLLGLAKATRLSPSYLSLIVNGKRKAPFETLEKIADALEVDVEKLKDGLEKLHGA